MISTIRKDNGLGFSLQFTQMHTRSHEQLVSTETLTRLIHACWSGLLQMSQSTKKVTGLSDIIFAKVPNIDQKRAKFQDKGPKKGQPFF